MSDPAACSSSGVLVEGVTKTFGGHPALRGIDLVVPERSITSILGPSGSGKTTLLRLIAGFDRPDSGMIRIGSRLVEGPDRHVPPEMRRVGYVTQEGSLFPHLDVKANVGFGLPRSRRRTRVAELLELTDMSELADRYPHQLSGGQQQRVALARALAPEPRLVLLDEPFASLDAILRAAVRTDMLRILRETGATALVVTHDQDEALSMADAVAVLRDGQVAQCGAPEDVYMRPADPSLAQFVGAANLLHGTVRGGRVETIFGPLPVADGGRLPEGVEIVAVLRPEQIEVVPAGDPSPVRGVVVQAEYYGHDSVVVVDPGGGSEPIHVRRTGTARLERGASVGLRASGAVVAWALGPDARGTGRGL